MEYLKMSMNENMVVIGGGGHAKSVIESITAKNPKKHIVITDASLQAGSRVLGFEVVGNDDMLPELYREGFREAVIAIGSIKNTRARHVAYYTAKNVGFVFPSVIDPTAILADSTKFNEGVFVGKNVVINADAHVDDFAIINTGTIIEHECRIGKYTHIAVGAVICGGCEIGDNVFVGSNATVIQGVKIGMNSIIGAGSVVLANVPENTRIVGVWGPHK